MVLPRGGSHLEIVSKWHFHCLGLECYSLGLLLSYDDHSLGFDHACTILALCLEMKTVQDT